MAKRAKGNTGTRLPPFTPILNDEMDSIAYAELTGTAVKAFAWFKRIDGKLRKKCGGDYNGIFDFTYTEARRYGFAKRTFTRVIDELNQKGFINIIKVGGMRGVGRSNSKYQLSVRWQLYGQTLHGKHLPPMKLRRPTEPV